ncbi:MAG: SatD family protein [Thermoflavifilum sp.]|nr:SatD family protein [Thermoflavifilum sp.]
MIMVAIITGDVVHSRAVPAAQWMEQLKLALQRMGKTPKDWEVFRGDSFQVKIANPLDAFQQAVYIKSCLKMLKKLDVRMAIGIGEIDYTAERISESNGTAFTYSGTRFDLLQKEKQLLAIQTPWPELDTEINLYIKLSLIAMNQWTTKSAEAVKLMLEHPTASQRELGQMLHIRQHAVSKRLKTAYFQEIKEVDQRFRERLIQYLS